MQKVGIVLIYCTGIYNIFLGIFHILFWKIPIFNWSEELNKLSAVNQGVMQVMNLCLITVYFIMAVITMFHAKEMFSTKLGRSILFGFSIFWFLRFIEQFLFWDYVGLYPIVFLSGFLLYLIPAIISLKRGIDHSVQSI